MIKKLGWLAVGGVALFAFPVLAQEAPGQGDEKSLALTESALDQRIEAQKASRASGWYIEPYRPSYILPVSYIQDPSEKLADEHFVGEDELDEIEIKFQFSFRLSVADDLIKGNGDLYFAYTQISVWQAYNSDNSSPFRDTNYEPEFFLSFDTDYELLGLTGKFLNLGAVHQSNGRGSDELSRSWNRLYANIVMERGNFACSIKPWYRIPEDDDEDNNPRIANYLGYGEFRAAYKMNKHTFSTMLRNNLDTDIDENHGAIELGWSFPMTRELKGYVQYFYGYGETLLDYDEVDERIGLGFLLADWL